MIKIPLYINPELIWLNLCLFISSSALIYFIYALNWSGLLISLVLTIILFIFLKKPLLPSPKNTPEHNDHIFKIFAIISLLAEAVAFYYIILARTNAALISPWTIIDPWFFAAIIIANFSLIIALSRPSRHLYRTILLTIYYFSILAIAAIVYKIGYGFDPFIHQAAMTEINRYGFILPKTPYYLGQYSLIVGLHKISGINLGLLNQYFLPVFAALTLPFLFSNLLKKRQHQLAGNLAGFFLILLGFSPFIATTPQNFSYLLLLATVIFTYKQSHPVLIIGSALATFAVHPLAGIPALMIVVLTLITKIKYFVRCQRLLQNSYFIFIGTFAIFCLTLWAAAGFGSLNLQNFNLTTLSPVFTNSESYWLNFIYAFINNYLWLLLISLLIIFYRRQYLLKEATTPEKITLKILSLGALAAISAYFIGRGFNITDLIAYEHDNYAARLPLLAVIMLVPAYWELFYQASRKALKQKLINQLILSAGAAILIAISIYGSYPRFDHYYNARGYSTSATDIMTVKRAEERAQGVPYIVLANQQVSAAAIKEFGFRQRYLKCNHEEIYFYPIPTGGRLYQYFLQMSYEKADRETMLAAMSLTDVKLSYLIINKYWWASDKIIAEAKLSADYWERIGQGENYLFEYKK